MPAKVEGGSLMPKQPEEGVEEDGGGTSTSDAVVKVRSSLHHRKVDDTTTKDVESNSSSEIAVSDGSKSCYIDTQEPLPVSVEANNSGQTTSSPRQQNLTSSIEGDVSSNGKPGGDRTAGLPVQPPMTSPRQAASRRHSMRSFPDKGRFSAQPYGGPSSFPRSAETFGDGSAGRYGWQFQPMWAATHPASQSHQQLYRQIPRYGHCQADRRPQGMPGNRESVIQQGSYPFTTSQNHLNPKCLSPVTYRSQEFYYPCPCSIQQTYSPSTAVAKELLEANNEEQQSKDNNNNSSSSSSNNNNNNRSKDGTTAQSHTAKLSRKADTNVPPRKNSATSPLEPHRTKDGEWRRRHGNHRCSSDSGWISDNSSSSISSSKDEEPLSPTLDSLGSRLQDVLYLEKLPANNSSPFLDNYLEDSQASSTSSQYPSTSDENESRAASTTNAPVKRNGAQQVRSMKPIPLRFANLLRAAAECAAERRLRLEGCPLVSHQNYRSSNGDYYHDVQEITHRPELLTAAGFLHPRDTASWCVPQFHQIPEDYTQYQGGNLYSCGESYFVHTLQPNLGSQTQNTISSQGSDNYSNVTPQYSGVSAALGNDQQQGSSDYYGLTPLVPLYMIPIDSVAPVNDSCAMYNAPTVVY